ncbi:MAG: CopG family transcriptional regulator [Gammaproteobacteria bacterium]|nr:MAG: CopG family transcriptional regulator [Gammaproteobacteria bacterium]
MNTEKLSISLPIVLAEFVKEYQATHAYKTKSEVIQEAVKLLRQKELENSYRQANKEADIGLDASVSDGLDDETR